MGFVYTQNPIPQANACAASRCSCWRRCSACCCFLPCSPCCIAGCAAGGCWPVYLCVYSVGRFFLEFLRGDAYRGFLFGFSTSQIISMLLLLGTLLFPLINHHRTPAPARGMSG